MSWVDEFADLGSPADYYPGSSKKITRDPRTPPPEKSDRSSWLAGRRKGEVDGIEYEFFAIGDLAAALNRKPVTIRLWESQGLIPLPRRSESLYPNKRHRLYTRPQVEGIARIAEEEGILHEARPRIKNTKFAERVLDLFKELKKQPVNGAIPWDEAVT